MNILNTPERTFKDWVRWPILCYVCFITIKNKTTTKQMRKMGSKLELRWNVDEVST